MKKAEYIMLVFAMVSISFLGFGQIQDEHFPLAAGLDPIKSATVYPNPATDFIILKLELPSAKRIKLAFHNIIGSTIEVESEILDDFEIKIKTKDLPVGYYLIALRDGDSPVRATYKFLKR